MKITMDWIAVRTVTMTSIIEEVLADLTNVYLGDKSKIGNLYFRGLTFYPPFAFTTSVTHCSVISNTEIDNEFRFA